MGIDMLPWLLDTVEYVSTQVQPYIGKVEAGKELYKGFDVKGELTEKIDKVAERAYFERIKNLGIPCCVVTEESGIIKFGEKPEFLFQFDPIDGTYNAKKGVARCGTAIVCTPNLSNPIFNNIRWAVVYDFAWERGLYADPTGAYSYPENERVQPSNVESLNEASLSFRIGYRGLQEALYFFNMLKEESLEPKQIRSEDVTVLEFSAVANGKYDAFVELRRFFKGGVLGSWDIAAPSTIVRKSGGYTLDLEGNELNSVSLLDIEKSFDVISAGTKKLLHENLEMSINALARQYVDIKGYPDALGDWLWFRKFMTGKTTLDVWRNREQELERTSTILSPAFPSVSYPFILRAHDYLERNPERLAEMITSPPKSSPWKKILIEYLASDYVSAMFGPKSFDKKLELISEEAKLLQKSPQNWLEKFLKIYKP